MFERLLKKFLPVAFGVAFQTLPAHALGVSPSPSLGVVIAQAQAGSVSGDGAATQEFISLYNNSGTGTDVTGWCVSNKSGASFVCLDAPEAGTTLTIQSHGYALLASDSFKVRYGGTYDAVWTTTNKTSGSLVGGSDTLSLLDANGNAVDSMGWTTSLAGGSNLTRAWKDQAAGMMLDTDQNTDFKKLTALSVPASGVVEEAHVVDVCANLDGAQTVVPTGYGLVGTDCVLDQCLNLGGLQAAVPAGMRLSADGTCLYDLPKLMLSELLPNPDGSDDGNEYVELYNPGDATVDLAPYRLQVGQNYEKTYAFAPGSEIAAHEYRAYYNDTVGFTLLNTTSRVRLMSADGQTISEAPPYTNPGDDQAWAFFGDTWLFTNQPTPGLANLLPADDPADSQDGVNGVGMVVAGGLKPCAANQYRNPDTNRCRSVVTAASSDLKPCKDGQYRSEETNRCRAIAVDAGTQKACADNQFRNPDTGRCKKIASEDEVKDCGEGRERNPQTHRCRNVVSVAGGTTASGVKVVPTPAASVMGAWAAGIVGTVAAGYGALEWRREIGGLFGAAAGRIGSLAAGLLRRP